MTEAYETHDAQFIQQRSGVSVANALYISAGAVPDGKVWTVLAANLVPSVDETQFWWFSLFARGASYGVPVTWPTQLAVVNASYKWPAFVREGMEFRLYSGQELIGHRDAATAGSTITIRIVYIETDLPYYVELDRQKQLLRKQRAMALTTPFMRKVGGIGGGIGGRGSGGASLPPRTR